MIPDLPERYLELWRERAAIMHEGRKMPDTLAGHEEADRRALIDILEVMRREGVDSGIPFG